MSKHPLKRKFLDIYLTTLSDSVTSKIQNLWGSSFYWKCSKFNLDFKYAAKNSENFFCFSDNCVWIGKVNLSLLRTGQFSSVANVLTSSLKICHVNKRGFFQVNWLTSAQWIWYRYCDADLENAWVRLPCCLSKGPLKQDFLGIYLTTFSEFVIWEIQKLWGLYFFSKCSKFEIDIKNLAKIWEKLFSFSDNFIWIGIIKLSLLRTGYFSLVADVLTSSVKIWRLNKREFYEHNFLASDEWTW